MKKLFAMLVAAAAVCLAGCGAKTPDAVAEKFMTALADGNLDKACEYASKDTAKLLKGMAEMAGKDEFAKKMKEESKGVKFKVTKTEVDGDKANVTMSATKDGKNEDEKLNLVKEDGEWKVVMKK